MERQKGAGGGAGVGIISVDDRNWKQSAPVVSNGEMGEIEVVSPPSSSPTPKCGE